MGIIRTLKLAKYVVDRTLCPPLDIPGFCAPVDLRFLRRLASEEGVRNCLEIGTFLGRSAYVVCQVLRRKRGPCRLVCVDLFDYEICRDWHNDVMKATAGYPLILKPYLRRSPKISTLGEAFDLTLERHPFMKRLVKIKSGDSQGLDLSGEVFDFAFIDADHGYEGVKRDFELVYPRLRQGGILCFHDNYPDFPGVQKLIREVRQKPGLVFIGQRGVTAAFRREK